MARREGVLWAVVAAAVLLSAGCSEGPSKPKPLPEDDAANTRPDAANTRPSAPPSKHSGAVTAYRAMWADLTEAQKTSDASHPRLDDHAKDGALNLLKYGLEKLKREKVVGRGAPRVHPMVVQGGDRRVELHDCVDSTRALLYKRNGELKNGTPGSHRKAEATVRSDGGEWKVTDLYIHDAGSC